MGHANSKSRAEVEQIVAEVKDLESYIIRNCQDFDDGNRDTLHKRLINYSNSLEEVSKRTKERHSKELKEAIRLVNKVIEELLVEEVQTRNLDQGAVETNSFIHVPAKNAKLGSVESLSKKPAKVKKDVINLDKYRLPSLEEIKTKTSSLKSEVENSIMNEDVNQMLVQQKIIQILATDLEMMIYEPHSPLQETKNVLEKDLSSLYRRLEKYKNKIQRRNSEAAQVNQKKEVRDYLAGISDVSNKADQILSQAHILIRDKKFEDISKLREQLENCKNKIDNVSSLNEEVTKQRYDVSQKINKIIEYVRNEIDNYEKNKKQNFEDEITKIEVLSEKYKHDIKKVEEYNDEITHQLIKKNLWDLENALRKIEPFDDSSKVRKQKCLENVKDIQELNEEKVMKNYLRKHFDNSATNSNQLTNGKQTEDDKEQSLEEEEEVILRKKVKPIKLPEEKRTIDGFYSYWKEIQTNLPASNCSLEELRQIALLLQDIENQIQSKRIKIQNFLKLKVEGKPLTFIERMNYEEYLNRSLSDINKTVIDEIDSSAVKTNAKIYELNKPKNLLIDDDKIIQNIEEINNNIKKIKKETAEKIILPPDSTSESSEPDPATSKNNDTDSQEEKSESNVDKKPVEKVTQLEGDTTKIVNHQDTSLKKSTDESKMNSTRGLNSTKNIEAITQIQNIIRNVEYLKEKATNFKGTKQTPKYADIKSKLDSYRKTLNILISYQNESITLSCNRILENIDEVIEILNTNTEKPNNELANNFTKKSTVESLFVEIVEIETVVEDLNKRINNFGGSSENDEYVQIRNTLLKNKEALNSIQVSSKYENIVNFRNKVMSQIGECLYNLNLKLEENKVKYKDSIYHTDETTKKILKDFQKIKDKINRFSGSYKNVLYKDIERGAEKCLSIAHDMSNDEEFLNNLHEDVIKNLKILEEKSIKESNYNTIEEQTEEFIQHELQNSRDNVTTDNAIRLSRIRQNFKDIKEEVNSAEKLTLEINKQLEHRIILNILELSSINIAPNEPFYFDKETLRSEFFKLLEIVKENVLAIEGEPSKNIEQNNENDNRINEKADSIESQLSKTEHTLEAIKRDIEAFSGERNAGEFFDIDEMLTRLSMTVEKLHIKKGDDLYKNKLTLLKNIYQCCETLEGKAQSCEILQNIEKRITEVTYRVNKFEDLSGGDYNALYRELTDLEVTLKDLDVGEDIRDKKVACQINIQQCLGLIEERISKRDDYDGGSDDGTLV